MKENSLFGNWTFYKKALAIAVPVMLQQLIMGLVSLVDNFMVAGLGDVKMASVNVSNQINFIYLVVSLTFMSAGGIYLAQHRGANNPEGMKQAFRFKLILSFIFSVIYMYLILAIPETLIGIMTHGNLSQEEIIKYGSRYMRIIAFTCIPMSVSFSVGTSFREIGKPKISLLISVGAGLVNTTLNYIFIYGNFGAPRLEESGAAIATLVARIVEAVVFILVARIMKEDFYVRFRSIFKINISIFIEMFKKSTMIFLSEIMWAFSETVVTALYNSRGGAENVAGMAAGFTIANIFYLVFAGIHTATAVLVGGTLGSGDLHGAKRKARWILSGSVVGGIVMSFVMIFSTLLIPIAFANLTVNAREITAWLVIIIALYMPLWTFLNAQFAVSRAGGDAIFGVFVDVPVSLLLFTPGAILLTKYTLVSAPIMFGIVKLTDFIKLAIGCVLLKKERWVRNITETYKQTK